MQRRNRCGTLVALGAVGLLAGAAIPAGPALAIQMTPELQKIVDGAKKEGELRLHMADSPAGGTPGVQGAEKGINKMFGTNIKVSFSPGPAYAALGTKILTEHQAGQPSSGDIYVATAVQMVPLIRRNLFHKVEWHKLYPERISTEMVEGDGHVVRHYTSLPGIIYNKRAEAKVRKVTELQDFLKPEWKGQFHTTPYLAGFDVLIPIWGYQKTEDFVLKMSQQIGGVLGCGAEDRIASGEVLVHVTDCSGSSAFDKKYRGVIGLHMVPETAWRRLGYIAIPKNARSPNLGILYALFFASKEGQDVMRDTMGYDQTNHPESNYAKEIAKYEKQGLKFRDVTVAWWSSQEGIAKQHGDLVKLLIQKTKK